MAFVMIEAFAFVHDAQVPEKGSLERPSGQLDRYSPDVLPTEIELIERTILEAELGRPVRSAAEGLKALCRSTE